MNTNILNITAILILCPGICTGEQTTFEATLAGKECQESSSQLLSCQYKVGSDLLISIDGIGGLGTRHFISEIRFLRRFLCSLRGHARLRYS